MNLDSHQHFWEYDSQRHTWITDEMSVLKRDFLPAHLLRELRSHNIDGCIAVQADPSETETAFLLKLADNNHFIKGVVGWVDLCAPDIEERLCRHAHPKLRGYRHIVQSEPDDRFMLRPEFVRGIAALRPGGFTYDILIYPRQLPATLELAASFPDQPFVIDHIAKPSIKEGVDRSWSTQIRELAQNLNVTCKISGLITEADWKRWRADDIRPYLDVVFEAFGPDRVMFGSDWPVCLLAGSYSQVIELVRDYARQFDQSAQGKLFGLNAQRFYGV